MSKAKVAVAINFHRMVMDVDAFAKLLDILSSTEVYDREYVGGRFKYFIYPQEDLSISIEHISEAQYALGKVAGKKEDYK